MVSLFTNKHFPIRWLLQSIYVDDSPAAIFKFSNGPLASKWYRKPPAPALGTDTPRRMRTTNKTHQFSAMLNKFGILRLYAAYRNRTKSLGKALSISVLNQIVSSATNFGLGIYLVRVLPPAEYGLYGIGFAISLFFAGIGNALFLIQMVVHTPDKPLADRLPYAARMLLAVIGFSAMSFLLSTFIFGVGGFASQFLRQYSQYGIAVTAASTAYLVKEFFVRHAYNNRKESWALAIHGTLAASLILLLIGQHFEKQTLTVIEALWAYALAHVAASLHGFRLASLPLRSATRQAMVTDHREAWRGGKWAMSTNFVYFLRAHAHTIIVAGSIGPIGVAQLNAARLFITPAVMLTPALSQIFMPRMAQARCDSLPKLYHTGRVFSEVLLLVAVLYSVLLLLAFDLLSPFVVGAKYGQLFWLVTAWCVHACILSLRNGQEITFQILKAFKKQLLANSISSVITLIAVASAIKIFGIAGAVIGLILGEISLVVIFFTLKKE